MRKKAENKIRQAAAKLGQLEFFRIDKVRAKAGLVRKVFDKTMLDMDRVGTIELAGGNTDSMSPSEIGNLLHEGENLHVQFKFLRSQEEPEAMLESEDVETATAPSAITTPQAPEPQDVEIVLLELDPAIWQRFEHHCLTKEEIDPIDKIKAMIHDYISRRE